MKRKCVIISVITAVVLAVVLVVVLVLTLGNGDDNPEVQTNVGLIRGLKATDGDYSMFMGIPYAVIDPDNPFGDSLPQPRFDEVFEAFDDTAICPQIEEFNRTIMGSLDCLHVNIYVPSSASVTNKLPVLVWIYGGGFQYGFHGRFLHGPRYLVRHDIIFATINYRVGPYGFMCLDVPEFPGNQGLRDQRNAMMWIKNNIEAFGGDPDKITIQGESAGAMSTHLQLLSPGDFPFRSVIQQSGTAFRAGLVRKYDVTVPIQIAQRLGYITTDTISALSFLASQSTDAVIGAAFSIGVQYRPCVELDGVNAMIPAHPIHVPSTNVQNMPVLNGFNSHEQLMLFAALAPEGFLTIFNARLQLFFDFDDETYTEAEETVRRFYIGDNEPGVEVMMEMSEFDSDFSFNYPASRTNKRYLDYGAQKIYYYMFSYSGDRNFLKSRLNLTTPGAVHADELGYLFDMEVFPDTPSAEDQLIIDRMTTMWANFVKYSDPTPETSDLLPVKWEPIVGDSPFYYLNIDSELALGSYPYAERLNFCEEFYTKYAQFERGYGWY